MAVLLFLLLPPAPLHGQDARVVADAGVNHALPPPGVEGLSTTYLTGGLRLGISGATGELFADLSGGTSLSEQAGSWGWGTLGGRLSGRFSTALGWRLSLTGSGFLVGEPTRYEAVALRLRPELRIRAGEGLLAIGARGGVGRSEVGTGDAAVETDLWSAGGEVEYRRPLGQATLRLGGGAVNGEAGDYVTGLLGLEGSVGPVWARGEVRGWRTPAEELEVAGSLRLSLEIGPALTGWIAGGRSDPDPLLGTPPGAFAGSGLSWRLVEPGPAPLPVRVLDPGEGRVRFQVDAGDAGEVVVVGDFSGWTEVPLRRRGGRWTAELTLEPGLYHYGFVVDGEWHVPEEASGRTVDEWGRPTATLLVPEPDGTEAGGEGGVRGVTRMGAGSSDLRRAGETDRRPYRTGSLP